MNSGTKSRDRLSTKSTAISQEDIAHTWYDELYSEISSSMRGLHIGSVNFIPNLMNRLKKNMTQNKNNIVILAALFAIRLLKAYLGDFIENKSNNCKRAKSKTRTITEF